MAPMSPTYDRLEAGRPTPPGKRLAFGWKKFALGAAFLLALVWLFVPKEKLTLPGWAGSPVFEKGDTPYEGRPSTTTTKLGPRMFIRGVLAAGRVCVSTAPVSMCATLGLRRAAGRMACASPCVFWCFAPPSRHLRRRRDTSPAVAVHTGVVLFCAASGISLCVWGRARVEEAARMGWRG
ncbi:hypothetical protein B0H17DRAFT_1326411 [Mycena rosella]|uniref:Transmembrane protein n=1 Tax=Mycena rosella TaxID=1033263 RepID=A0AAD7GTD0_MYCRO|nr:hypothetical protein B0H17DRAFT_1326411 [Mycena rosella]